MANETNDTDQGYKIWFPYEIFYIESMLTITANAMSAQLQLQEIMKEIDGKYNIDSATDVIIQLVQNLLSDAAAISRYFWPASNDKVHKQRGQRLRQAFEIHESNPLKDRDVRNVMEHFDEKLDLYLNNPKPVAGTFMPTMVGIKSDSQGTVHPFRAFYTNDWTFEALGKTVEVIPIVNELIRIHNLLIKFRDDGGRLPRSL